MAAKKSPAKRAGAEAKAPGVGRFIVEIDEARLEAFGGPAALAERFAATLLGTVVNPHDRVARVELEA